MLVRAASNVDPQWPENEWAKLGTLHLYSPGALKLDNIGGLLNNTNWLTLLESGPDTALFLSEPLLLTIDDAGMASGFVNPDDAHPVWSVRAGSARADDAWDDRTRRAALAGGAEVMTWFQGDCPGLWYNRHNMRPVSEERRHHVTNERLPGAIREAHVRVRVHLEPYQNVGFNEPAPMGPYWVWHANRHLALDAPAGEYFYDTNLNGSRDPGEWQILIHEGEEHYPDVRRMKFSVDKNGDGVHGANEPYCYLGFEFWDADGDGHHDADEASVPFRDLSSFNWNVPQPQPPPFRRGEQSGAGVWGPVASSETINAEIARANLAWAQAGIRFVQVAPIVEMSSRIDHPTQPGSHLDILHTGELTVAHIVEWIAWVSRPILGALQASPDVADITFTGWLPGALGWAAIPASNHPNQWSPHPEGTYIGIGPNVDLHYRTLAHELGHGLANQLDAGFQVPYLFFPRELPAAPDTDVATHRRTVHDTEIRARTQRPVGALDAPGNRFTVRSP
jgi:hypothetical protein